MFDPNITVLVADDMKTMRKIVIKGLMDIGFKNFLEAVDGQEAWMTLNANADKVKLVVSDWNMPNCSGLDFLKRVRADGRFKKLPFVLVTAESEMSQVAEAVSAGVDNYVVKPFKSEDLKTKLEAVYKKCAAAA